MGQISIQKSTFKDFSIIIISSLTGRGGPVVKFAMFTIKVVTDGEIPGSNPAWGKVPFRDI